MKKHELLDRIEAWLMLHSNNKTPLPNGPSLGGQLGRATDAWWAGGLLKNATELEVVSELKGTPAEARLVEAIELATTGDATKLDAIEVRLQEVHRALRRGPQQ